MTATAGIGAARIGGGAGADARTLRSSSIADRMRQERCEAAMKFLLLLYGDAAAEARHDR